MCTTPVTCAMNNPCLNGGSCSDVGPIVMCDCMPGWQGSVCDVGKLSRIWNSPAW